MSCPALSKDWPSSVSEWSCDIFKSSTRDKQRQKALQTNQHRHESHQQGQSEHCPEVIRGSGGHPSKLTHSSIHHAIHLLISYKAENAIQVTRELRDITNTSLSQQNSQGCFKRAGLKAVVKKKKLHLSARHRGNRLDFAISHKDWTIED